MSESVDIAVIGAGVIGCSVAYHCAKKGARVALIDAGDVAGGTSSKCDGNVLACDKQPGYDARLTMRSQELLDVLAGELEYDFEWERRGSLLLMETPDEVEMSERLRVQLAESGMSVQALNQQELREREPYVASDIPGGLWFSGDGCLNPMRLCYGFVRKIKQMQGVLLPHTKVLETEKSGDGFVIRTSGETIFADQVVNCGGVHAPALGAMMGLSLPIKGRQGQLLVAEQSFRVAKQKVMEFGYMMAKFQNQQGYKRPVSASMERHGVALVYEPTGSNNFLLGSSRTFCGEEDIQTDIEILQAIAARGIRFFPVMEQIKVIRSYAGVRPYTPDHMPIVSATPVSGYFVAAGHEGDGVGLSPITGLMMSQLLFGARTEFDLTPLSYNRFINQ